MVQRAIERENKQNHTKNSHREYKHKEYYQHEICATQEQQTLNFTKHDKTRNFKLTKLSVQLNFQDLEEFHPTTGYCESSYFIDDRIIERENKHNNTQNSRLE